MIYILDSNAMAHLRGSGINVTKEHPCYVPKEIREEFLGHAQNDAWFSKSTFISPHVDFGLYLAEYASILNRYSDVSFYNLKGFGDVAILANAAVLLKGGGIEASLFIEPVCVVTKDNDLREFALTEFSENFSLMYPEEFAKMIKR